MEHNEKPISLPVGIVSPTDVARLTREIEAIDSFFKQQEIRSGGESNAMPRLSKLMDQLASDNQLNLLQENDRNKLSAVLGRLHQSAPVLHISFSVDPPGVYVQKIVAWLRGNIHEHALITVGLQPNIGAGCIVRTTNKLFDFSLREYFAEKRGFFIEKLHDAITDTQPVQDQAQVASADTTPRVIPQVVPINSAPSSQQPVQLATEVA